MTVQNQKFLALFLWCYWCEDSVISSSSDHWRHSSPVFQLLHWTLGLSSAWRDRGRHLVAVVPSHWKWNVTWEKYLWETINISATLSPFINNNLLDGWQGFQCGLWESLQSRVNKDQLLQIITNTNERVVSNVTDGSVLDDDLDDVAGPEHVPVQPLNVAVGDGEVGNLGVPGSSQTHGHAGQVGVVALHSNAIITLSSAVAGIHPWSSQYLHRKLLENCKINTHQILGT